MPLEPRPTVDPDPGRPGAEDGPADLGAPRALIGGVLATDQVVLMDGADMGRIFDQLRPLFDHGFPICI